MPEWRNALSLVFAAFLDTSISPERGIRLLYKLIDDAEKGHSDGRAQAGLLIVIANCTRIVLGKDYKLTSEYETKFRQICLESISSHIPINDRAVLGIALGHLGDPRIKDLKSKEAYIEVPAGDYRSPSGKKGRSMKLLEPFLLARYPVTNSQFEPFIKAGGYRRRNLWCPEGFEWLEESRAEYPRFWKRSKWNAPNQPVVGVNYFEAQAFCKWIGGRLPTSTEWELAAGGKARELLGGIKRDQLAICNCLEMKLGVTTAVGLFHETDTIPSGFSDMIGNVWQWVSDDPSTDTDPPYSTQGYMCGISFADSFTEFDLDTMAGQEPSQGDYTTGFRPVLSKRPPTVMLDPNEDD